MLIIPDEKVIENLNYHQLIAAIHNIFLSDYTMPLRHHHFYKTSEGDENTLILMPAWNDEYMGLKQVTVSPGNNKHQMPAIFAQYFLSNAKTGQPLALMNAAEITARRTACTSALASRYLSRKDSKNLLVVGGGKVAQHLIQAHLCERDLKSINVWMRNTEKLDAFISVLQSQSIQVTAVENLENAVRKADIISCATLSKKPIIKGNWLKKGVHLDLIGSHKPDTREVDDDAILLSTLFVDSRMGALHETGELAIPIAQKIISENDIKADLTELIKGIHKGRKSENEITLFKSAGLAIEDLAAALLVYQNSK